MLFSDATSVVKVLGLTWNPQHDTFNFKTELPNEFKSITKRSILSLASKLFDPLGLVSPVIVETKIILQALWQLKIGWDESIPADLHTSWMQIYGNLSEINQIIIPRICCPSEPNLIQLHGFADASEKAYGACIYIKSIKEGKPIIRLLCAKSKVAPLKRISLPRLELCAALLLVRLKEQVVSALNVKIDDFFYWSDSMITLAWIAVPTHQVKTFVANRVTEILESTQIADWHHVPSADNPADIVSRGMSPANLVKSEIWWNGPSWLNYDKINWPKTERSTIHITNLPEARQTNINLLINNKLEGDHQFLMELINAQSSVSKLQRILAYVYRFITNLKVPPNERSRNSLSVVELENAMTVLIKNVQLQSFSKEVEALTLYRIVCHI